MNCYLKKTAPGRVPLAITLSLTLLLPSVQGQTDVANDDDVIVLEKFEVFASSIENAIEVKRDSELIGSFLGSDSIADLPDDDLGEALSRLPGVNVIGGAGADPASVTIRGAEGQYNTIRINGAAHANAGLGSRDYDLNQIPTEMVSRVEVIKSITAEHPADSIGGAVNVVTATAFSLAEPVARYKFEARFRDQGDEWGWGTNLFYADIFDAFGGEKNFGMFVNVNYIDESLIVWNTQNRFLSNAGRLDDDDPNFESFANQTILAENPDAQIPIWDRFDTDERRIDRDELTINASFDYKLSDRTSLYFRPWLQFANKLDDLSSFRIDRLERAFDGNWFFLDENGDPLGSWEDSDGDGVLGSAGDTFINAVDANGNLIVTSEFEANADGRTYRGIRQTDEEATTYTLDFGGITNLDEGTLDYRFLYSVDDGDIYRREWRFEERFDDARGDNLPWRTRVTNGSTPLPEFIVFEVTEEGGHVPANDRVNVFGDISRQYTNLNLFNVEDIHEDVIQAEANYDHRFSDSFNLKTGVHYRLASRENITTQLFFTPSAGSRRVFSAEEVGGQGTPLTLWDDRYAEGYGPFLTVNPMYEHFFNSLEEDPASWEFTRSDLRNAAETADLEEEVSAAYIQGRYRWNNLTAVAGVRYERTSLDTTWRPSNFRVDGSRIPGLTGDQAATLNRLVQETVQDIGYVGEPGSFTFGEIVDDIKSTNDYDNIMPSVVLTYRLGETGHLFRFAWTNTLTRPDYRELVPFDMAEANRQLQEAGVLNLTNRSEEFDLGNPNLTEQTSRNFDLAWEYYFGPRRTNMFSVTVFRKDLEDFLQQDVYVRDIEVLIDPNDPSLGTETVSADTFFWTNASERTIEGVEVSAYFDFETFFPDSDLLSRFSIVPNYTYITGNQTNPIFDEDELAQGNFVVIGTEETDSLTNQAEHIVNIQLLYEISRFNFRLSYNYISELQRTPSTAAISDRTFDTAQERWDLSIQYYLSRENDLRLFAEIDNITDQPQDERFIGKTAGLYTTSFERTGRRFVVGIRGRL